MRTGLVIVMTGECARRMGSLARMLALGILAGGVFPVFALACTAETEHIRTLEPYAQGLPDCRAYEQVTPVDKDGTNPGGEKGVVQASVDGNRITFMVSANMPGASGGDWPPLFLAERGGEGWLSQGLQTPRQPHGESNVVGWTEDLSEVLDRAFEVTPGSGEGFYLRDSSTGTFRQGSPPVLGFNALAGIHLAGFSSDGSRIIFATREQLLKSAAAGENNLYELHNGALSLVGVLPDGSTPPGGSAAGPGSAEGAFYTQSTHTISSDGSRIFFNAGGAIYVRENDTSTILVGTGTFVAATLDGSKVFYLAGGGEGGVGGDLTEFDLGSEQTTDLTPTGLVQGVLGVSSDGSYVYFAANSVLASGASQANCGAVEEIFPGEETVVTCLYVWHNGGTRFIARLIDSNNWLSHVESQTAASPYKTSQLTPDGKSLLFSSSEKLTGLDNAGTREFYRYNAVNGHLSCVSCGLGGAHLVGSAGLRSINIGNTTIVPGSSLPFMLRNISADGSRVFFESPNGLLPQDTNGVQDVYEWEQQGVGNCQGSSETFSAGSGGCLYLISPGTSPEPSFLADASASGNDVFFFTYQSLVGQDQDGLVDIYDGRVGGGLASQNPPAPAPPCEGEGCKAPTGVSAVLPTPVSATFSGPGNLAQPEATPPPASTPKPKTTAQIRAQKLATALKACHAKHDKRKRTICEHQARRRYGPPGRAKSGSRKGGM